MPLFNPCAVIPVYNHSKVLRAITLQLCDAGLQVVLVDDGSNLEHRTRIEDIANELESVQLVRLENNSGKGAALKAGLQYARSIGFSHALQIDADGQHDRRDVSRFIETARQHPNALICGFPVYDDSIPRHRLYGRYATHIWVWINTVSLEIRDSMCGFRVYPVEQSCALIARQHIGNRMEFDGEFIVRWYWTNLPIHQLATRVTYPEDGISHFRLWRDNGRISLMHARLFFGMLMRLPALICRTKRAAA